MTTEKKYDVFGVGNAIVDILAQVPEDAVENLALAKGSMTLMDTEKQSGVLHYLEEHNLQMASGGSAANTMVAIAQSGGKAIYCGKVADDTNGVFYRKDMDEVGIDFPVKPAPETGLPTGTSVILTTPDAERTMCTHLGISATLTPDDINVEFLKQSKVSYVEGYLWTGDETRAACLRTFEESKKHGVQAAFTLSDMFLVELFGDQFRDAIAEYCDIVFCNADEAKHFLGTESLDECADKLGHMCDLVYLTDGPNGCRVIEKGAETHVAGYPVTAIDTVGAGDAFAGGVLFGITNGYTNAQAAKWGNYFASRVVEHIGPRHHGDLESHLESVMSCV